MQGIYSGFSLVGSFLILLSYATVPTLRQHPTTLVFFLSLCDFCFSMKYFAMSVIPNSWEYEQHAHECLVEALWSQFFGLSSVSWNAMISINLMLSISDPFTDTKKNQPFYHAYVWTLSVLTALIMALIEFRGHDLFQPSGDGSCWFYGGYFSFYSELMIKDAVCLDSVLWMASCLYRPCCLDFNLCLSTNRKPG